MGTLIRYTRSGYKIRCRFAPRAPEQDNFHWRAARSLNARISSGEATLLPPRTASLILSDMTLFLGSDTRSVWPRYGIVNTIVAFLHSGVHLPPFGLQVR